MAYCLLFFVFFSFFLSPGYGMAANKSEGGTQIAGSIGAIVDVSSPAGKEENRSLHQAAEAFHRSTGCRVALHVRDSQIDPVRAISAAMELIKDKQVDALIGLDTWQEAAFVAELGDKAQVPVLSLAETSPSWFTFKWPFLIRVARNKAVQLKAMAAIVGSGQWQRVTVIYEDMDFVSSNIIPQLSNALLEVNSVIDYQMALPPSPPSLSEELGKLMDRQSRIFIVYTSMKLAVQLFRQATQMGMMDKEYVWITSNDITSLLDTVNSSVISSMQGIIGVMDSSPPNISNQLPGINLAANLGQGMPGAKAYDALWAVASALNRTGHCRLDLQQKQTKNSTELLETILASNFEGLSGNFRFQEGMLVSSQYIAVVNVVGKSYKDLGFWSEESGFMRKLKNGWNRNKSMRVLGQIYWPGGPWSTPRGWAPPTGAKQLVIGVPARSAFPEFVKVNNDDQRDKDNVTGFSIDVFKAVLDKLPYELHHYYFGHNGSYDSMVQEVGKAYDIVVGDTSIVSDRYQYVHFSQPYAEPGLVMLVSAGHEKSNKAWMFMKPFTLSMWAVTAFITLYNGFVVWLIEKSHEENLKGNFWKQAGLWIWLSFTTLFSHHGERPLSNLSIVTMVVWLFVTIILTSSYTANLTSMLTFQGLGSVTMDVGKLKLTNAMVGCDNGSFVVNYLVNVLGFDLSNIKQFSSGDEYPKALKNGEIRAAFLRAPFANVLVAKYCEKVVIAGPVFDVGGFGFAFPKGSPILPDVSQAILQLSETGTLEKLYNKMISSYNCSISDFSDDPAETLRLSTNSFSGLFVITGVTSTVSLVIFVMRFLNATSRIEAMYQNLRQTLWRNSSSQGSHPTTSRDKTDETEMQESQSGLNGLHSGPHLEASENGGTENSHHGLQIT